MVIKRKPYKIYTKELLAQSILLQKINSLSLSIIKIISSVFLVFGTTIAHGYVPHEAGSLLFKTDSYSIHKVNYSGFQSKKEWCGRSGLRLVVIHKVNKNDIVTPDILRQPYGDYILDNAQKLCPQKRGALLYDVQTTHYFDGYYIDRYYIDEDGIISPGAISSKKPSVIKPSNDAPFARSGVAKRYGRSGQYWTRVGSGYTTSVSGGKTISLLNGETEYKNFLREAASINGIADFWSRGGFFLQKKQVSLSEKAKIKLQKKMSMLKKLEKQYGVRFQNHLFAALLDNNIDVIEDLGMNVRLKFYSYKGGKKWDLLRTYLLTSSRLCGKKTVGKPEGRELKLSYVGGGERGSGIVVWMSQTLDKHLTQVLPDAIWGGSLGLNIDDSVQTDTTRLIKRNGCASEPMIKFEKNFLLSESR